jgi:hypothetical protein
MAVTVTKLGVPVPPGDKFNVATTFALDNSYPAGGYILTPATFGFAVWRKILNIEPNSLPAAATWVYWIVPTYNQDGTIASVAFRLAVVSTGVEVGTGVNLSTASFNFVVEGS